MNAKEKKAFGRKQIQTEFYVQICIYVWSNCQVFFVEEEKEDFNHHQKIDHPKILFDQQIDNHSQYTYKSSTELLYLLYKTN